MELGCEPGSNLLFLSAISNQCCSGYVRWCLTLLFMACRLSGTSVGGWVKYFGRRGIMEVQQAWIREIKAWKKVVSSFLAAHIFLGLTASFALCKGRIASREDYSFVLTAGYGWMAAMAKFDESLGQKPLLFFRLSFSCSSLLVLIYVCETFYNVIAQLHRKCKKVNEIISWMRIIPISLRWLFLHLRQFFETTLVNTTTKMVMVMASSWFIHGSDTWVWFV